MERKTLLTILGAVILFVTSLAGGATVIYVSKLSVRWKQLCNALAGGVLIAVALCHMLADSLGDLEPWGKAMNKALGGDPDDAYPIGLAFTGCGFFLVVSIEYLLGGHHHGKGPSTEKKDGAGVEQGTNFEFEDNASSSEVSSEADQIENADGVVGVATLAGLTVHSLIEGIAAGSEGSNAMTILLLAIMLHKGFAAFAVSNSLIGLRKNRLTTWWALVFFFALTSPIGMAIGAILSETLDPSLAAFLQCLAAGTLLAVGIGDMIMPALEDVGVWRKRKLLAAIIGFFSMGILAVWS